ncbi:uncharacterized protein LOC123657442 [Melitaea cinxia]|uniref:uncharacterized protein LOC123657442 n=1 Tax=Melitaea cinxia TaxID=113334 RepID=UPI001E274284|nr:uncharacterized protein LOC123657442 [Melitaea cinxia]
MDCGKCNRYINDKEMLKCATCSICLHYQCADFSEIEFKKILPMNKMKWKCQNCKSKKHGTSSGTHSPKIQPTSLNNFNVDPQSQALMQYFDAKFETLRQQWRADLQVAIQEVSSSIKQDIESLESRLTASETRIIELEQTITSMSSSQSNFNDVMQENSQLRTDLECLQAKFDDLDQVSRSCNVEIQNIPEKKAENLVHLSIQIGKLIGIDIKESDIRSVHRVAPGKPSNRPKNIVLQLSTRRLRDDVIAAARARRTLTVASLLGPPMSAAAAATNQDARFYINEHLTLKNKLLFSTARQHAKDKNYKYIWVKNHCILLRKSDEARVVHIRCGSDLKKIL